MFYIYVYYFRIAEENINIIKLFENPTLFFKQKLYNSVIKKFCIKKFDYEISDEQ